ncbi:hypothetical protein BM1_06310 [Bipolaris maydis]|nr:hypothetical protein BM1_06310 [Bipolaris maydis]
MPLVHRCDKPEDASFEQQSAIAHIRNCVSCATRLSARNLSKSPPPNKPPRNPACEYSAALFSATPCTHALPNDRQASKSPAVEHRDGPVSLVPDTTALTVVPDDPAIRSSRPVIILGSSEPVLLPPQEKNPIAWLTSMCPGTPVICPGRKWRAFAQAITYPMISLSQS